MLISFRVKNFRSIVDATMDMSYAEGKAPNGYKEMETIPFLEAGTPKRERVVPCLALYGPNAGGKTNLIRAMHGLGDFLLNGVQRTFLKNRLHPELKNTCFDICFEVENNKYQYTVCYSNLAVEEESLRVGNDLLFSIKKAEVDFKRLATDFYSEDKLKDILKVECSDGVGTQVRSFFGKLGRNYAGLNKKLASAWLFFEDYLEIYPSNEFPTGLGIDALAAALNAEETPQVAFDKIEKVIKTLDLGIKRMTFDRKKAEKDELGRYRVKGLPTSHRIDRKGEVKFFEYLNSVHEDAEGNEVIFNFAEESDGTQAAFGIIGILLSALEQGKVVVIDELDRSLHSLVFREIVRIFKDKRYNKKNAQLIFTAHNLDLLDSEILRISEIGIVEKTIKHGTVLRRLSDFDGVRNVTNFRHQYLNGSFSGIPFPYI